MAKIDSKNKSSEELENMSRDLRAKLSDLSFDLNEKKLKDVSQIKKTKKDLARVLTELNNKHGSR